jgi:hypothetical protein
MKTLKFVYATINFILSVAIVLGIVIGFVYPFLDLIKTNQQTDYLLSTVRFTILFVILFDTPDVLKEKGSNVGFAIHNFKISLTPVLVMAVALAIAIVILITLALPAWLSLFSASTLTNEWLVIPTKTFLVIFSLTIGAALEYLVLKFMPSKSDSLAGGA